MEQERASGHKKNPFIQIKVKPKNVLMILVESLSSYAFHNHMPELNQFFSPLKADSYFTDEFYASAMLSQDAMTNLFLGLPNYFDKSYFKTKHSFDNHNGLLKLLKPSFKKSFYLHGAEKGAQNIDTIALAAGFDEYLSSYNPLTSQKKDLSVRKIGSHNDLSRTL